LASSEIIEYLGVAKVEGTVAESTVGKFVHGRTTTNECRAVTQPQQLLRTGSNEGRGMKRMILVFFVLGVSTVGPLWAQISFIDLCKTGTADDISQALKSGASVKTANKDGQTPLMMAAMVNPRPEVIVVLLKAGAKITDKDTGGATPLMYAAVANPNADVVSALLNAGASVNDTDVSGGTALLRACQNNTNVAVITTLLKAGSNINVKNAAGQTPLIMAVLGNTPTVIRTLVKSGADKSTKDFQGKTAADYAGANDDPKGAASALRG